jgi:choline dehydrogenase
LRADRLARAFVDWAVRGRGAIAAPPLAISANVATRADNPEVDLHVLLIPLSMASRAWFPGLRRGAGPALGALWSLNYPRSRGRIALRSADPADHPAIDYGLLSDPFDQSEMLRGYHICARCCASRPWLGCWARRAARTTRFRTMRR